MPNPPNPFPGNFITLAQDKAVYAQRRARLAAALVAQCGPKAVAVIPTAPEQTRNRDCHFPYRADSYFYYLTGFTEPGATLVIDAADAQVSRSILYCLQRDIEREIWDGYRLGPEAAPEVLGVCEAHASADKDARWSSHVQGKNSVWFPFAVHADLAAWVHKGVAEAKGRARGMGPAPTQVHDLCPVLDDMRLFKDAGELALMRTAAAISAQAHKRCMRVCAERLRAGKPLHEYHLEAELLHAFRSAGAESVAYNSIVAAGANAAVLHYRAGNTPVRSGDLVLIDAGCELHGYASDITRTFPANGRFSAPQRDVYDVVAAALEAAVQACRAGQAFSAPHEAALRVLTRGLMDLGIINCNQFGDLDSAIEQRAYAPFYMHRTSHWLGLDVHDCGSYTALDGACDSEGKPKERLLADHMVLTLEPGLYIRPSEQVPQAFHHIGIRIEDDAVVQGQQCELLTRAAPVAATALEAWMQT